VLGFSLVVKEASFVGSGVEQGVGVSVGSGGTGNSEGGGVNNVVVNSKESSVVEVEGSDEDGSGASGDKGGLLGVGHDAGVASVEGVRVLFHFVLI